MCENVSSGKFQIALTTEATGVFADLLDIVQVVRISTHAILLVPWAVLRVDIFTIT